jgi:hypothetical protein
VDLYSFSYMPSCHAWVQLVASVLEVQFFLKMLVTVAAAEDICVHLMIFPVDSLLCC